MGVKCSTFLGVTHALVAAVGFFICGPYYLKEALTIVTFQEEVAMINLEARFLDTHLFNVGCEGAKEALEHFLSYLNETRPAKGVFLDEKTYRTDATMTYYRLGRVEETLGNREKGAENYSRALSVCPGSGWSDCSVDTLRTFEEKLEKIQPMIRCLSGTTITPKS